MTASTHYWRHYHRCVTGRAFWGSGLAQVFYGVAFLNVMMAESPLGRALVILALPAALLLFGTLLWLVLFLCGSISEPKFNHVGHPSPTPPAGPDAVWRAEWPTRAGYYMWRKNYACGCCCVTGMAWVTPLGEYDIPYNCYEVIVVNGRRFIVTWGGREEPHRTEHGDRLIDQWFW